MSDGIKAKLENGRDDAYLSRELSEIDRNVPIDFEIGAAKRAEFDAEKLVALFERLNFNSFIKKFELSAKATTETIVGEGNETDFESLIKASAESRKNRIYNRRKQALCKAVRFGKIALCAECIRRKSAQILRG